MKKLKIGIWIDRRDNPRWGGAHSYIQKLIRIIDEKIESDIYEIVLLTEKTNADFRKQEILIPTNYRNKYLRRIFHIFYNRKLNSILERNSIDVIYFPRQNQLPHERIPSITTNWDIGHKSSFPFPEFVEENRENGYRIKFEKSLLITAESQAGRKEILQYYDVNPEKIHIVHLFPGGVADVKVDETRAELVMNNFRIEKNEYFLYPAQFWAHKNHYKIINAFKKFNIDHPNFKLILCGSDHGNLEYIDNQIIQSKLSDVVMVLGFVSNEELNILYKNATALVMPTFLGPTNMPLLEARRLSCPALVSDFEGHREMLQDAAIYFDQNSEEDIYSSMIRILDSGVRLSILESLKELEDTSYFNEITAAKELDNLFKKAVSIRSVWK